MPRITPGAQEPHCGDWTQPHMILFQRKWERPVCSICFLIFTRRRHAVHTFMFIHTYQCMDNLSKKRIYMNKKLLWKKNYGFSIRYAQLTSL